VKSWVEVSEQRLAANYRLLTEAAGEGTAVLAVVKANAYGHGAAICAPVLARAGADWLGVTDVAEGAAVRAALTSAGISSAMQPEILVMSGLLLDEADAVMRHRLTPVVWDRQQMEWLADAVSRAGSDVPLAVHVEIDTGMARQGVRPGEDLDELLGWLRAQSALRLDGVMTHFASSEVAGSPQTVKQAGLFEEAMGAVKAAGLEPTWVHAGNSSTVDNQGVANHGEGSPAWLRRVASSVGARSMVRTGLGLYGYCLPIEQGSSISSKEHVIRPSVEPQLQTVMTWKTRVIGLRDVHPGDTVGYNAIFSAQRPMRLALLPVGYADGLRRELSCSDTRPGGWVMVRGRCAPVVGRVSMNLTIVDVTEIPDVAVGDEAIVLGEGITANDHARIADTIAYEIVCGVRASSRLV
jgi:alanine racemase